MEDLRGKTEPSIDRLCVFCEKPLPSSRWRYCSDECFRAYRAKKYQTNNPKPTMPTNTVGAIAELRVAVDLLSHGYHVFRAMSPSCPCDLAVLKDGKLLKIEARKVSISASGKVYRNIARHDDPENIDIYAWVLPTKIIYEPELSSLP